MRVDAQEQWPGHGSGRAVVADRLGDRQHLPFVERTLERRAAVLQGVKGQVLCCDRRVGQGSVSRYELPQIDQR